MKKLNSRNKFNPMEIIPCLLQGNTLWWIHETGLGTDDDFGRAPYEIARILIEKGELVDLDVGIKWVVVSPKEFVYNLTDEGIEITNI